MGIEELSQIYQSEWVLAEVLETDEEGAPKRVKVIRHSKSRDEIYKGLGKIEQDKHVCTLYTGEIPKEGYAVAFTSHGSGKV